MFDAPQTSEHEYCNDEQTQRIKETDREKKRKKKTGKATKQSANE